MCIWSQADATFSTHPRRVQVRNQRGKTVERRVKQVDYIWDLDDGAPGFLKRTRRDRLKLYADTDRNGLFTRGDVLLGKTFWRRAWVAGMPSAGGLVLGSCVLRGEDARSKEPRDGRADIDTIQAPCMKMRRE